MRPSRPHPLRSTTTDVEKLKILNLQDVWLIRKFTYDFNLKGLSLLLKF